MGHRGGRTEVGLEESRAQKARNGDDAPCCHAIHNLGVFNTTNKFIRSKVKSKTKMVILAVFLAIPYNWEFRIYFVLKILQSQWFDSKWIVSFCTCTRWLTGSVIAFPVENLFGSVCKRWGRTLFALQLIFSSSNLFVACSAHWFSVGVQSAISFSIWSEVQGCS